MIQRLLDDHGAALYSDFQRVYHLDLLDCLYRTHTPEQVVDLIKWLPDDSAFHASLQGGEKFKGWGSDRYLIAYTLEMIMHLDHSFTMVNTDKKNQKNIPQFKPLEIPGRDTKKLTKPRDGRFGGMVRTLLDQQKK